MTPLRILIAGASGRMGHAVGEAIAASEDCVAVPLPTAASGPHALPTALLEADAIIDFSVPQHSVKLVALAAQARIPHIIGTTGFDATQDAAIAAAARHTVIVKSGNMSRGVAVLAEAARRAALSLGPEFDVEIVEMHHRAKRDAPSGTALLLGAAVAAARGAPLETLRRTVPEGVSGARPANAIGFASLRGGDVVGDHSVILAGPGERIELTHRAGSRTIFANGALTAARWARGRPPGLYSMTDVLAAENDHDT